MYRMQQRAPVSDGGEPRSDVGRYLAGSGFGAHAHDVPAADPAAPQRRPGGPGARVRLPPLPASGSFSDSNHVTMRISPRPCECCVPRLLAMLPLASKGRFNIMDDICLLISYQALC